MSKNILYFILFQILLVFCLYFFITKSSDRVEKINILNSILQKDNISFCTDNIYYKSMYQKDFGLLQNPILPSYEKLNFVYQENIK